MTDLPAADIVEQDHLRDQLTGRADFLRDKGEQKTPILLYQAADEITRLRAQLTAATRRAEIDRSVITEANNSLFGSQGYFLSLDGSPGDKHHLAAEIENLKSYGRKQWRRAEQAERMLTEAADEITRLRAENTELQRKLDEAVALVERATATTPHFYLVWHSDTRAFLTSIRGEA